MYSPMTYSRSSSYSLSADDIFLRRNKAARAAARSRACSSGSTEVAIGSLPGRAALQDLHAHQGTVDTPDDVVHERAEDGPAETVVFGPVGVQGRQGQGHAQARAV